MTRNVKIETGPSIQAVYETMNENNIGLRLRLFSVCRTSFMILNSLNAIWRLSFIVLIRYNCLGVMKEYYMHPLFGNQCIQCFLNPISLGDVLPLNQDVGR